MRRAVISDEWDTVYKRDSTSYQEEEESIGFTLKIERKEEKEEGPQLRSSSSLLKLLLRKEEKKDERYGDGR